MKKWLCLLLALMLLFTLTACGGGGGGGYQFDETDMRLIQFETPADEAPAVHFATSMGDIWLVLYPDEAPVACENFTALVNEGWYDSTEFFRIEPDTACIGGSQSVEGDVTHTLYNDEPFENEYTMNLWPFSGALATISDKEGMSDSRFFVIGDVSCPEEYFEAMETYSFPKAVMDKFREVGGVPPFTQRYTVFGQVVKGMEVVNAINDLPVDDNQYPTGAPVVISSVTMTTVGEIPA